MSHIDKYRETLSNISKKYQETLSDISKKYN